MAASTSAVPTPRPRHGADHHADLPEPHPRGIDVDLADQGTLGYRDHRAVDSPAGCHRVNVKGRFSRDSVALLGDLGEQHRDRAAIILYRGSNREFAAPHCWMLAQNSA